MSAVFRYNVINYKNHTSSCFFPNGTYAFQTHTIKMRANHEFWYAFSVSLLQHRSYLHLIKIMIKSSPPSVTKYAHHYKCQNMPFSICRVRSTNDVFASEKWPLRVVLLLKTCYTFCSFFH